MLYAAQAAVFLFLDGADLGEPRTEQAVARWLKVIVTADKLIS
jgi:hypothetical protein